MDFPFFLLLRLASKYLIESISLSQLLQCAFFVFRFEVRTIAHFGQHIQLQGFSRAKSFPLIFLSIILGQKTQEQSLFSSRTSIFRAYVNSGNKESRYNQRSSVNRSADILNTILYDFNFVFLILNLVKKNKGLKSYSQVSPVLSLRTTYVELVVDQL